MRPKTGYARNDDIRIAYQVVGDGPIDLVMTPGYVSHLDLWWMLPETTRFMQRLASFSRLILYDKRGTGLSDPAPGLPAMDERMEDLHAVLDAVGSEHTALLGFSEGGPLSMLFAATYPERTTALALFGSFARFPGEDYLPHLLPRVDEVLATFADIHEHWGEGRMLDLFAPDLAHDTAMRESLGLYERLAASPAMASALLQAAVAIDVTHVLSSITCPTLVVHRRDEAVPLDAGRDLAERIPGARMLELPGTSHLPWLGESETMLDALEEFFTGAQVPHEVTRALVTMLFTDIVGSTDLAGELGDARWRSLLERHDALVRREVTQAGGAVVKSMGDGAFARFDGPARAIRAALSIVRDAQDELGVQIRAGVHTGECELLGNDLGGMAVHLGARIAAKARGGEVLVSAAVRDLVLGSPIGFEDRGVHELKGVPGTWQLLAASEGVSGVRTAPEAAYPVAPNAPSSTASDRAVARAAKIGRASPRLSAQFGHALRRTTRARGARSGS
ncbi:adenylate/guanylate cyclase domain-containing protein [Nocardioides sp. HM23]|uniref:adenylate/guanylate cyclase domain-containing protein n=1 Tax=Nocardioides bizhenqiangii TaxID=3095076 RepID=UPI002ACA0F57|nr:adenylate/guanylate cyclase domain-containing protein [Nocardioides sp. HM23]MDZ5622252.1 adenylate/guanylate cyclase domain-containing protein [Nocardioides sp. HM23]